MKSIGLTGFAALLIWHAVAQAGIADSPLPVLVAGQTTYHLYSVPGINGGGGGLGAFFRCTSTETATMKVGVETFASSGGAPSNDAAATSLDVAPGQTVTFGCTLAVGFTVNSSVGCSAGQGSARILATSKKLACTAFVADNGNAPPTVAWQLTIIAKTKQKAAN